MVFGMGAATASLRVRQALTAVGFGVVDQIIELELKWSQLQLAGKFFQLAGNHGELHHQLLPEFFVTGELRLVVTPVLPSITRWQRPLLQRHGDLLKRCQAMSLQSQKVAVDGWEKRGVNALDLWPIQRARIRRWIHVHWPNPGADSLDSVLNGVI